MTPETPCRACGARVPERGPGEPCPGCLLKAAAAALAPSPGERFGPYELLGCIARGGMGVVYRARHTVTGREVALKMLHAGSAADAEEQLRFSEEIKNAQGLEHANIVPVYEAGELGRTPYFTMPLMAGSLQDRLEALAADRRRACEVLATVARAVHFAHQRGIVHRDLKPSNVLFDGDVPRVADFGTAKNLNRSRGLTVTGTVMGTPGYMSPEQMRGNGSRVDATADVYSLGAMLYEVLTGRPPFTAETVEGTMSLVLGSAPPARPREVDPTIDRPLEVICLHCLEKEPGRRYPTALELAEDLRRYLVDEPLVAQAPGPAERAWLWGRRFPAAAASLAAAAIFLPVAAWSVLSVARTQADELRAEVLAANRYAARMAAGAVLFQFRNYSDRLRAAADSSPHLVRLLEQGDFAALADAGVPPALQAPGAGGQFDSWLVDTADGGVEVAHWPDAAPGFRVLGKSYLFRDYLRGGLALGQQGARAVHVSRAFATEADGRTKFFFSTPLYAQAGGMVGVMGASVPSDSTLGSADLSGSAIGVIISPRDRSREEADGPLPDDYVYVVHPGLAQGRQVVFGDGDKRGLREARELSCEGERGIPGPACVVADPNFRDAVPGYEGRWLAGLAPITGSPFVMVVQTRDDDALRPGSVLWEWLLRFSGPMGAGALLLGGLLYVGLRRRR